MGWDYFDNRVGTTMFLTPWSEQRRPASFARYLWLFRTRFATEEGRARAKRFTPAQHRAAESMRLIALFEADAQPATDAADKQIARRDALSAWVRFCILSTDAAPSKAITRQCG